MKKIASVCFIISLAFNQGYSQGYFPLQKGNQWDFGYIDFPPAGLHYTFSAKIVGDTLMTNAKKYAIVKRQNYTSFLRQEGNVVYGYGTTGESIVYDFTWKNGDTIAKYVKGTDSIITIVRIGMADIFGKNLKQWSFTTTSVNNLGFEPSWVTITDSMGYTYIGSSPGAYYYCMGILLNGVTYGSITFVTQDRNGIPGSPQLYQNYPNPFNPSTRIRFTISTASFVSVKIYDVLGKEITTLQAGNKDAGDYTQTWDATNISSGVYFCVLRAGEFVQAKKLVVQK